MNEAQPNVAESTGVSPNRAWVEAADQQEKPSAPGTDEPGKDSVAEQAEAPKPEVEGAGKGEKEAAEAEPVTPKGVQERIDQLTRLRREAEEKAAALRAENDAIRRDLEAKSKQGPAKAEPKLDDFETHEEWQKALIDYRLELKEAERSEKEAKEREERTKIERQSKAAEVGKAGIEKYKDFGEKCFRLPIGDDFLEDLFVTQDPVDVIYHLGSNPEDFGKVITAPRNKRVYMLAQLDMRLAAAREQAAKAVDPVSKAPPPIKPLKGGGEPVKVDGDKLSGEDWFQRRRKGQL